MRTATRSLDTATILLLLVGVGCGGTYGGGALGGAAGTGTAGAGGSAAPGGTTGAAPGGTTGAGGTGGGAGTAGTGGIGGFCFRPGDTGTAGAIGSPGCAAPLCGNGVRDTCNVTVIDPRTACPQPGTFTEYCDGADLGTAACANVGFASGALACSAGCRFDTAGCSDCAALDANVVRCGDAPVAARPSFLAVAATNDEVGLAWVEEQNLERRLFFARLSPSLDLLSSTAIAEPMGGSYMHVAVAPLPSGWVLAWRAEPNIFMQAISAAGADLGRTTVTTSAMFSNIPILVARPDGGPLIGWETPDAQFAGVLQFAVASSDGKSVTAPQALSVEERSHGFSAAFVGNAFYVTTIATTNGNAGQLRVKRVETDGTPTTVVDALRDVEVNTAALVAGGDDLRVVYAATGAGLLLQKLSAGGSAVGAPVPVDRSDPPHYYNHVFSFAIGPETATVLSASDRAVGIARFGSSGAVVTPTRTIAQSPQLNINGLVVAGRGPDLIVAWFPSASGGIRIARITP